MLERIAASRHREPAGFDALTARFEARGQASSNAYEVVEHDRGIRLP